MCVRAREHVPTKPKGLKDLGKKKTKKKNIKPEENIWGSLVIVHHTSSGLEAW